MAGFRGLLELLGVWLGFGAAAPVETGPAPGRVALDARPRTSAALGKAARTAVALGAAATVTVRLSEEPL